MWQVVVNSSFSYRRDWGVLFHVTGVRDVEIEFEGCE